MKKVGVVTFHRGINYGALLQTYALITTLQELGIKSNVIDYRAKAISCRYKLLNFEGDNISKRLENLSRSIRYFVHSYQKKRNFCRFINQYLPLSAPADAKQLSSVCCSDYSALISGSDQVFNPQITKEDRDNYVLAFAPEDVKRYSYAASFGYHNDILQGEEIEFFRRELSKFSGLSARENSGVEKLQKLSGKSAQMHLDPTLLLSGEKWEELCEDSRVNQPYILMYLVHNATEAYHFARKLSEEKGLPVLCIPGLPTAVEKVHFPGLKFIRSASPERFLALIRDASYVVTTSFHGTVFSILFRKPFVSFASKRYPNDDRIMNLLRITGLENRLHSPDWKESTIDWNAVEKNLGQEREYSRAYLRWIGEESGEHL